MIPEVLAVVEAAERVADSVLGTPERKEAVDALRVTVDALRIRRTRTAGTPTFEETDREWGDVVAGDEIMSAKNGKWYEVTRSVVTTDGLSIKINIKGNPKPIVRKLREAVRVKRGIMGDAADLFQLLWSAQTRPEHVGTAGTGPMLIDKEDDSDA